MGLIDFFNRGGPVSEGVRRMAAGQYPPDRLQGVIDLLGAARLPYLEGPSDGRDRVHMAMLRYAGGDEKRLAEAVEMAETDWRDLLMAVGMDRE